MPFSHRFRGTLDEPIFDLSKWYDTECSEKMEVVCEKVPEIVECNCTKIQEDIDYLKWENVERLFFSFTKAYRLNLHFLTF